MRNVDSSFDKKEPIKHIVKINIYYQKYRNRTKIDVIKRQKQSIILGMLWLAYYNLENDKISKRIQKVVETEVRKTRVAKTKERKKEERKEKEKTKERMDNKSKEGSREIGNLR